MTPATMTAALFVLIVLFASVRLIWKEQQADPPSTPWRMRLLLMGQAAGAALLYLTMFPPGVHEPSAVLTVITAGADAAQIARVDRGSRTVALPEAPPIDGVERTPDLAAALRRHPAVSRIRVVGGGLPRRDLDVASRFSLAFDAADLSRGVSELRYPQRVPSGARWRVIGQVNAVPDGSIELLDPSRQAVSRSNLQAGGRFALDAIARTPGRATYVLQLRDGGGQIVEDIDLPLLTIAGSPLRMLVLSGAPGPELKYLRRWAVDAGAQLGSDITLRPGVSVLRSATPLTAGALGDLDIVMLDERAWQALDAPGRRALTDALKGGLGILLRITGSLDEGVRDDLRSLGFTLRASGEPQATTLDGIPTSLTRRPLTVEAINGVPLLRDSAGEPLALWRAEGRGRIAVWWLSDSFRIALDGIPGAYGSLWADALGTVARASADREPELPGVEARVNRRQVICGLGTPSAVIAPDGKRSLLLQSPSGCAGYWPEASGWHVLSTADSEWPFYVRSLDEAATVLANDLRRATASLVTERRATAGMQSSRPAPGSPWPYFVACLLVLGATWWLERSRVGIGEGRRE